MPLVKPQHMKSLNTIALQPQKIDTPKIDVIMCMDLAGKSGNEIAAALGMQAPRISIIRNSPMYMQQREVMRESLKTQFMDKQSEKMTTGDPVSNALKDAALEAAREKIRLMQYGESEFVRSSAAGDILDRAGYKANETKTVVSVQITEKMADRFEHALKFTRSNTTVTQPTQPSNQTPSAENQPLDDGGVGIEPSAKNQDL